MNRITATFCLSVGILAALPTIAVGQNIPELTGRVIDTAEILSPATEKTVSSILESHENSTSNQIAVLTINSLNQEAIETYSLRVARLWGLGTAELDNGVLLLIAVNDREMRIEVGLGLEGVLTDSRAGRIIRGDMRTYFQQGDYDAGVLAAVQNITGVLEGTYDPPEQTSMDRPPIWFGLIFLIVPMMFMFIGIATPGSGRWFLFFFLIPFFLIGGSVVTGTLRGGGLVVGIYAIVFIASTFHPKVKAVRSGKTVKFGPFSATGFSSSSGGSSWSSSGGSSWSSSSGSSFSGGGGSFGGGGSSGGW